MLQVSDNFSTRVDADIRRIGYLESIDVTDETQNEDLDLTEEFIEDYSNYECERNLVEGSNTETCIHLDIEVLGENFCDFLRDEITTEFVDDLAIEMKVDEVLQRKISLAEDGLGKTSFR